MKSRLCPLLFTLLLSGCSVNFGETQWMPRWDSVDIAEAVTYGALSVTDGVLSTLNTSAGCSESDPIITNLWGTRYPTSTDYAVSMAINAAVVLGVAEVLPGDWRKLWLLAFVGDESWAVVNNTQVHCTSHPRHPIVTDLGG